jgi:hypothetical protein
MPLKLSWAPLLYAGNGTAEVIGAGTTAKAGSILG